MSPPMTLAPPAPPLRCTVLTDPGALEAQRGAWLDLLERSAANEPMLSPTWLLNWWRIYGTSAGRTVRVGLFFDGDRLVGLAPLHARRHRHRFGIPFRRLEPLGSDVDEGDGVGSDYLGVIAERGAEARVAGALAAGVAGGAFGPWDEVVVPVLNGDTAWPALLTDVFRAAGFTAGWVETTQAPYLRLPAAWSEYLQSLPSKKRRSLQYAERDLEAWAGGPPEVRWVRTPADLDEGKRVLAALHSERWTAAGKTGAFAAARFQAFHDAVLPEWLAAGALELAWLTACGEPLAACYNIHWDNKVYFYQSGRKPDLPGKVRPGIVLLNRLIQAAIQAGRREYDFLGDPTQYKLLFTTTTRPLVQFRAARPSLVEWARRGAELSIGVGRRVRAGLRAARAWLTGRR
jgi:CelD/BcsL family acetyltransferase involved in cellulose biosynthesis